MKGELFHAMLRAAQRLSTAANMRSWSKARAVLTTAFLLGFLAPMSTTAQTVEVPQDWIGYGLGLTPPTLRAVDRATYFPYSDEIPDVTLDARRRPRVTAESTNLMAMGPDGTIYEVVYDPADFARLAEELERLGQTGASSVEPEPEARRKSTAAIGSDSLDDFLPEANAGVSRDLGDAPGRVIAKGWSLGTDMRQRMSPLDSAQFNRTGSLSNRCTATLFGNRVVITAFHCLWDGFGNWIGNINFAAGHDGIGVSPFGVINHTWKYWSPDFVANNCHKWKTQGWGDCSEWDWAIVVLASPPTHLTEGWHPGWMGFAQNPDDDVLESWWLYNRGYPGCSQTDAPAGCVSETQWAQSGHCKAYDSGSLEFRHSCDTSKGHSGGPVYSWTPGSQGPYVVGINSSGYVCKAPSCDDVDPSNARRVTKKLFDKMAFAKSAHP